MPRWAADAHPRGPNVAEQFYRFQQAREQRLASRHKEQMASTFGLGRDHDRRGAARGWGASWEEAERAAAGGGGPEDGRRRRSPSHGRTFHRFYFFSESGPRRQQQAASPGIGTERRDRTRDLRLLGIPEAEAERVTPDQVKKAFHRLAWTHHPDRQPRGEGQAAAAERFRALREAYGRLVEGMVARS